MALREDADGDGRLTLREMPLAELFDRSGDGVLVEAEYAEIKRQARAPHTMVAVRLGQRGDLTEKLLWRSSQALPNVPTPIVYRDTLFVLKEGGILSSLDPRTGNARKRGRLDAAPGEYYASPVAGGGRLYLANLEGKVVVVKATPEWEVESVGSLDEPDLLDSRHLRGSDLHPNAQHPVLLRKEIANVSADEGSPPGTWKAPQC